MLKILRRQRLPSPAQSGSLGNADNRSLRTRRKFRAWRAAGVRPGLVIVLPLAEFAGAAMARLISDQYTVRGFGCTGPAVAFLGLSVWRGGARQRIQRDLSLPIPSLRLPAHGHVFDTFSTIPMRVPSQQGFRSFSVLQGQYCRRK